MKSNKIMGTLVASAFAGALASSAAFANKHEAGTKSADHSCESGCHGKSSCKGEGSKGTSECAGKNACAGQGKGLDAGTAAACTQAGGKWVEKKTEAKPAAPAKKKG